MNRLHHAALSPSNFEASLAFYRDGVGLDVLADFHLDGNWEELFGIRSRGVRAVMLGHPDRREAGMVELVQWDDPLDDPPPAGATPTNGFMLLAFHVDMDATCARLRELGYEPKVIDHQARSGPMRLGTVRDPDGVMVEFTQFLEGAPGDYEVDV